MILPLASVLLAAALPVVTAEILASTLGDDLNLACYINTAPTFSSLGDGFGIYQRDVSTSIPFSLADDSAGSFPPDELGIIDDMNTDPFFGVTDTVNGENVDDLTATWVFDIACATSLSVSVDVGAMGDFESSDTFRFSYQVDNGVEVDLFSTRTDEAGSFTYTLAGGAEILLNDPLVLDETTLSNELQTFSASINGSGQQLAVKFTANTNGGDESFAFQNVVIMGTPSTGSCGTDIDLCSTGPPPPPPTVFIHEVQGAGDSSLIEDAVVSVEAVVVGSYTESYELRGFFLQEEDTDVDSDPMTSEGIFVFCGNDCPAGLLEGNIVKVTGEVSEFFSMTQISAFGDAIEIMDSTTSGLSLVSPVPIFLPASGSTSDAATFEAYEGMLVEFEDDLTVSEYFELARYGQLVLFEGGRPSQFTETNPPSVSGYADFLADLDTRRIILDDLNNIQNAGISSSGPPYGVYFPGQPGFSADNTVRGGDLVQQLRGIMHWSFAGSSGTNHWRIRPTKSHPVTFQRTLPRPMTPPTVGGKVKVAAFNVLNLFTTECERGASSAAEFEVQLAKIVTAILALDADIVGLIEVENMTNEPLMALVNALNAGGSSTYAFVDYSGGTVGTDAIKQAFIYKSDKVCEIGAPAILDGSVDQRFLDTKNRPFLIQTFSRGGGCNAANPNNSSDRKKVTIAVGHLKSKGSSCDDVGNPNANDGQGNCAGVRTDAAEALVDYLATDPTGSNSPNFMVIGDLNSYAMEDAIIALEVGGYTNLVQEADPASYTYLFSGQIGTLDYAMASKSLAKKVTGAAVWNINADEVPLLDYNDDIRDICEPSFRVKPENYAVLDEFRSSDHDPVIVGLFAGDDDDDDDDDDDEDD